jgi:hypothetical protein
MFTCQFLNVALAGATGKEPLRPQTDAENSHFEQRHTGLARLPEKTSGQLNSLFLNAIELIRVDHYAKRAQAISSVRQVDLLKEHLCVDLLKDQEWGPRNFISIVLRTVGSSMVGVCPARGMISNWEFAMPA